MSWVSPILRLHYLPAYNRCDPSSTDRPNGLILIDVLLGQHTTFSREIPILCQHFSDFEPVSAVASLGPGSREAKRSPFEASQRWVRWATAFTHLPEGRWFRTWPKVYAVYVDNRRHISLRMYIYIIIYTYICIYCIYTYIYIYIYNV